MKPDQRSRAKETAKLVAVLGVGSASVAAINLCDDPEAHAWTPTVSTAYCLSGVMADGSYVRVGSVASNRYALGTKIRVRPSFYGRHRFIVRDRIGYGTELDFWTGSCGAAISWGRRVVSVEVGWRHRVGRVMVNRKRVGMRSIG